MQVAEYEAEDNLCEKKHYLVEEDVAFDQLLHHHDLYYDPQNHDTDPVHLSHPDVAENLLAWSEKVLLSLRR